MNGKVIRLFNVYNSKYSISFAGNVFSEVGLAPTILTMPGGGVPMIRKIYESDKLREQGAEQRRLEEGRSQADAGAELRQVLQCRDELAEGLYDSDGL